MIVYQKDGKDYLLLANSSRGVMKVTTEKIESADSISLPVKDGATKGLTYETIAGWTGVDQLDRLDAKTAIVLRHHRLRADTGVVAPAVTFVDYRSTIAAAAAAAVLIHGRVMTCVAAPFPPSRGAREQSKERLVIRWTRDSTDTNKTVVEVSGIRAQTLRELQRASWGLPNGSDPAVYAEQGDLHADVRLPPMAGEYPDSSRRSSLRAAVSFGAGVNYRAVLNPDSLPGDGYGRPETISAAYRVAEGSTTPSTVVTQIYPSGVRCFRRTC